MNEQQFQLLYAVTARPILAYLIGVTFRRDVAEDLSQETYWRFLVSAANCDGTQRNPALSISHRHGTE
jgi:DNA-directed RNA polymerase specialized sigma24 family protein